METDLIQLFEAAKKDADAANAKGILLGQTEASRCVQILSQLKSFPISRITLQANRLEQRLEYLTKHKTQKIRSTASILLLRWRRCIRNQESQDSTTLIGKSSDLQSQGIHQKHTRQKTENKPKKPLEVSENLGYCGSKGRDRESETIEKKTIPTNKVDLLELLQTVEKEARIAAAEGSSSTSASRCVEALNQIERISWSLVHDAIFTTKIGNRVHSLIRHSNSEIRSSAESLYYGWLRILYSSNGSSNSGNNQQKKENKGMNKKIGGSKNKKCTKDRINSVLKNWKSES